MTTPFTIYRFPCNVYFAGMVTGLGRCPSRISLTVHVVHYLLGLLSSFAFSDDVWYLPRRPPQLFIVLCASTALDPHQCNHDYYLYLSPCGPHQILQNFHVLVNTWPSILLLRSPDAPPVTLATTATLFALSCPTLRVPWTSSYIFWREPQNFLGTVTRTLFMNSLNYVPIFQFTPTPFGSPLRPTSILWDFGSLLQIKSP